MTSSETKVEKVEQVLPWSSKWPWNPDWVVFKHCAWSHSLTLDYDETMTIFNNGVFLHAPPKQQPTVDMKEWDEVSRSVALNYHGSAHKNPSELCGAKSLFMHIFGGASRALNLQRLLDWARVTNVRLRMCSRSSVAEIMGGLTAVNIDPRFFYEIYGKSEYDSGPWMKWSRSDNQLHKAAFEVEYDRILAEEVKLGVPENDQTQPPCHSTKLDVLSEIMAQDKVDAKRNSNGIALFVDDTASNCTDAESIGFIAIEAGIHAIADQEIDDIKQILLAGCVTLAILERRQMAKEKKEAEEKEYKKKQDEEEERLAKIRETKENSPEYLAEQKATQDADFKERTRTAETRLASQLAEVRQAMLERKRERESALLSKPS